MFIHITIFTPTPSDIKSLVIPVVLTNPYIPLNTETRHSTEF